MLSLYKLFKQKVISLNSKRFSRNFSQFCILEEVEHALKNQLPVVALESTIITHGMPFPKNIECALSVEEEIRKKGCVPATIAILNGKIKVGLTKNELELLADKENNKSIKTSRRDFAYVVANKLNGGTTVSGTLLVCKKVGIPIFATGGIGGVHRFGEKTLDISADLIELGKTPVAIFSSGAKSILDIPKTLEFLETQGVFVATYGDTTEFPAFYSKKSKHHAPYNVKTSLEAAKIIFANHVNSLQSGMLFGVPVPEEHSLDENEIEEIIKNALELAKKDNVVGKNITPFLLDHVSKATKSKSLETNIALVKNNARVAAEVSLELSRIRKDNKGIKETVKASQKETKKRPVIIGGSVLDRCITVLEPEIKLDGRIHDGKFTESPGGVARNIADAISKINEQPIFISVIGNDTSGEIISNSLAEKKNIEKLNGFTTAQCAVVFDECGECKVLIGDMEIFKELTPEMVEKHEGVIKDASILVLDGNPPMESLSMVLEMAQRYQKQVFFEPTDHIVSEKPFKTPFWKSIKYISPNLNELRHIARTLGVNLRDSPKNKIDEAVFICKFVAEYVDNVIVTLGADGLVISRYADACRPLFLKEKETDLQIRHYPGDFVDEFINVSGAGDCLVAGLICSMLKGLSEEICMSVGFEAAKMSLKSKSAVPSKLFGQDDLSWKLSRNFNRIM
nr:pseudouridine-metabolizing bifunctional protein C1861.05 [Onthophagus taurus]